MIQKTEIEMLRDQRLVYRAVKRAGDIVLSALGLALLSPLLLITAALIWLEDHGTVIFCQERNGLNGEPFRMYKFRTMVPNADALRSAMERYNELDGPAFKMKRDPRVTKIGAFLRKTSIDELPQLVNILRGEMSLVGPRPLPTYETAKCTAYQKQRLLVKPGLTCYWQISGRNDVSFDEWIEMDLEYIRNAGVATDIAILFKTARAVLTGRGAY